MRSVIFILIFLFLLSACGEKEIKSYWLKSPIVIDGNQLDWQGKLNYFEDQRTVIGFINDDRYLYICVITSDTAKIMQALNTGLTFWLNPQNGEGKTIGIQFPLRNDNDLYFRNFLNSKFNNNKGNFTDRIKQLLSSKKEYRLVNENLFPLTQYYLNDSSTVEVKAEFQMEQFVIELRIPLSDPIVWDYNLQLEPGNKLSFKLESGEIKREQPLGNNTSKGMSSGQRGGMNKGRQSSANNMRIAKLGKIEISADIILATSNEDKQ